MAAKKYFNSFVSPLLLKELEALRRPRIIEEEEYKTPEGYEIRKRGVGIYVFRGKELLKIVNSMSEVRAVIEGSLCSRHASIKILPHGNDRWRVTWNGKLVLTTAHLDSAIEKAREISCKPE